MNEFDAEALKVNLQTRQENAWRLAHDIAKMSDVTEANRDDYFTESMRDKSRLLAKEISQLRLSISFALERSGAKILAKQFANEKLQIEPTGDPDVEGVSCQAIETLSEYISAILDSYDIQYGLSFHLGALEKRLKNTPRILDLLKVELAKEGDVKKKMHQYLRLEYGDAVNELPLPKGAKTYRPDTGIRSLLAAIEYKFADSEQEARNVLEEIYADVECYRGFKDFRNFFAVLYMTKQFLTQDEIDNMFAGLPGNWKIVSVVGHGARSKKKAADPT